MTTGRAVRVAALFLCLASAGCVERRFVIESNVPNAQVYINDKPIGAAPAHSPFEYYGYYNITISEPGYETISRRVHVRAPWYGWPPFDFLAEAVYPFHIRDTRRYYFELHEAQRTRPEDLITAANELRLRGQNLPTPEQPAPPKVKPGPQPQPGPAPGPGPVVPPVGPPIGPAPGGTVPSVLPGG